MGVIQCYCGVAAVDGAHQIIVEAQAHGTGSEQELLLGLGCRKPLPSFRVVPIDIGSYLIESNGMELILIGTVAFVSAGLTFFSGFGLGTVLMPALALFFPVPVAIAATALVHFSNNVFKFGLLIRQADWRVAARFGLPAALAAVGGASLLNTIDAAPVLVAYRLGDSVFEITLVKVVVGVLIVVFSLLELWPRFNALEISRRWLFLGGALSGFFGGLSGNQGALRSAFLIKAGLSKEAFVVTGAVAALIVDATRLLVYGAGPLFNHFEQPSTVLPAVAVGCLSAFAGTLLGKSLLQKVTLRAVQFVVAAAMLMIGAGLVAGLI